MIEIILTFLIILTIIFLFGITVTGFIYLWFRMYLTKLEVEIAKLELKNKYWT